MVAYGIMDALLAQGRSIPGDCSVCGFDNIFPSCFANISLTTIDLAELECQGGALLGAQILRQMDQVHLVDLAGLGELPGPVSISDGSDPEGQVTREQFVTMLWRLSGEPTVDLELFGSTDPMLVDSDTALLDAFPSDVIVFDDPLPRADSGAQILEGCGVDWAVRSQHAGDGRAALLDKADSARPAVRRGTKSGGRLRHGIVRRLPLRRGSLRRPSPSS